MNRREALDLLEQELGNMPAEKIPELLQEIEGLRARAWAKLFSAGNGQKEISVGERLLSVEEAAQKLSMTKDYLYRHADRFPFTVRPTPSHLRFSLQGIEKFIRQRTGYRG